ncbi:hypothetical protein B0H14DRAFT_2557372 [Mycena olivaceomarginata]|nr:hypothetical protein B0H14DRAFT_2557372 [Mycena olivaceomarginata]
MPVQYILEKPGPEMNIPERDSDSPSQEDPSDEIEIGVGDAHRRAQLSARTDKCPHHCENLLGLPELEWISRNGTTIARHQSRSEAGNERVPKTPPAPSQFQHPGCKRSVPCKTGLRAVIFPIVATPKRMTWRISSTCPRTASSEGNVRERRVQRAERSRIIEGKLRRHSSNAECATENPHTPNSKPAHVDDPHIECSRDHPSEVAQLSHREAGHEGAKSVGVVLEHPIPMVDRGVFGAEPRTEHGTKIRRHKVVVEQTQDLREYVRDSAGNVSQGARRRRRSQPEARDSPEHDPGSRPRPR